MCCVRLSKVNCVPYSLTALISALLRLRAEAARAAPTGPTGRSDAEGAQSLARPRPGSCALWLYRSGLEPRPRPELAACSRPFPSQAGRTAGWGPEGCSCGHAPSRKSLSAPQRGLLRLLAARRNLQRGQRRLLAPRTSRKTRAASLTVRFPPDCGSRVSAPEACPARATPAQRPPRASGGRRVRPTAAANRGLELAAGAVRRLHPELRGRVRTERRDAAAGP